MEFPKKKNNGNNYKKNINDINEEYEENEIYEEQDENKDYKVDNNNNENNNNRINSQIDNYKNFYYNNMVIDNPNYQEYFYNNNRLYNDQNTQKSKYDDINKYQPYDSNNPNIGYILNQFVNNLSYNVNPLEFYPNEIKGRNNKRKNTIESLGEESLLIQDGNINYLNQNNNYGIIKSRKNSVDSLNKVTQNDKNDLNIIYKKMFGNDEINQNKSIFDTNELKNPIFEEDDNFMK